MADDDKTAELQKQLDEANAKIAEQRKDLAKASEIAKQFEGIDLEALKAAQEKLDQIEHDKDVKNKDFDKILAKQKADSAKREADKDAEIARLQSQITKGTVDNEIRSALTHAKVAPECVDMVLGSMSRDAEIRDIGGVNKVMIGHQTVAEHVDAWAKTDMAKRVILAADNSGGGSGDRNSGGGTAGKDSDLVKFYVRGTPTFDATKQTEIFKKDLDQHQRLVKMADEIERGG